MTATALFGTLAGIIRTLIARDEATPHNLRVGGMERRAAVTIPAVDICAPIEDRGDDSGVTQEGSGGQRGVSELRMAGVRIGSFGQDPAHGVGVALCDRGPQIGSFGLGWTLHLPLTIGLNGLGGEPHGGWHHGHQAQETGQQNPLEPLLEQRLQAAPAPHHGGEEAANQEEQRHAEAMRCGLKEVETAALAHVPDQPRKAGGEGKGGVILGADLGAPRSPRIASLSMYTGEVSK